MTSSTEYDQQRAPGASPEELQLVASLREGDERAFAQLVDRYHAMLLRLARGYVGSSAAAEDVVQESWIGGLKGIRRFEARAQFTDVDLSHPDESGPDKAPRAECGSVLGAGGQRAL